MARMTLDDELEELKVDMTSADFLELLEEQLKVLYPLWSVDDLVCHPDDAADYRGHIRRKVGCPEMTDCLILKSLMNARRSH
jgi:hypothetical protein